MARCTRKKNLEVHHKRRDGGNGIGNAYKIGDIHTERALPKHVLHERPLLQGKHLIAAPDKKRVAFFAGELKR